MFAISLGESAVVRGEDDEGVFLKTEFLERGEHLAHAVIDRFHHRRVAGVILIGGGFILIPIQLFRFRLNRGVDEVMGKHGQPWLALVFGDEVNAFVRQNIGDVGITVGALQVRRVGMEGFHPVSRGGGAYLLCPVSFGHIKAALVREITFAFPAVPLAKEASAVATLDKRSSEYRFCFGKDVAVLVDCHSFFDVELADDVARRLEPFDIAWYEEPVAPDRVATTREIADRIIQPLAGGELLFGVEGFEPLCKSGAVDVIMPDVKHCGGLQELMLIAQMAHANRVAVAPHNPSGPVSTAASVAVSAAIGNFKSLELQWGEVDWRPSVMAPAELFVDGTIGVPGRPGFGVELNDAVVAALEKFEGIDRRFQNLGEFEMPAGTAMFVDDYGHHPTEVAATLAAARSGWPERRTVLVFQPHRYTRTRDLMDDFASVLSTADVLVVLEVYAAGEAPIAGADGRAIARAVRTRTRPRGRGAASCRELQQGFREVPASWISRPTRGGRSER